MIVEAVLALARLECGHSYGFPVVKGREELQHPARVVRVDCPDCSQHSMIVDIATPGYVDGAHG